MNMQEIMRQAQQMKEKLEKAKQDFDGEVFEINSNDIKITIRGDRTITSLDIHPDILEINNKAELEDLLIAAVNKAAKKVESEYEAMMKKAAPGMPAF